MMCYSCLIYIFSLSLLAVYGVHRTYMLLRVIFGVYKTPEPLEITDWPKVCVQIPIYNESAVAKRVVDSLARLDYPLDKLELQILDDSNDETVAIVDQAVSAYSNYNFKVVRRQDRKGYKAGALTNGLKQTDAEYIVMFDADFIPEPDFIKKTIPHFRDNTAFVQGRWTHLNRSKNLLTKAQAILLDGHFLIEHPLRYMCSFFNFNGTAGVWRKSAIADAGGWQGDTLTEDLDLSYRARLRGWDAVYLRDVTCPAELPESLEAFKSQQNRWMKGTAQVCRKLLPRLLLSRNISFREKIGAFFHLTSPFCYIPAFLISILFIPVAFNRTEFADNIAMWLEPLVLFLTLVALIAFYAYTQFVQDRKLRLWHVALGILVGISIAPHGAASFVSGLFNKGGEFVRTPKFGISKIVRSKKEFSFRMNTLTHSFLRAILLHKSEAILTTYFIVGIFYMLVENLFGMIPFLLILFLAYSLLLSQGFKTYKR